MVQSCSQSAMAYSEPSVSVMACVTALLTICDTEGREGSSIAMEAEVRR